MMGTVFEEFGSVAAEPSAFRSEDSSCHGIITGVTYEDADEIIEVLNGIDGENFRFVQLPRAENYRTHTLHCRKIFFDPEQPDRFLAIVLAKPTKKATLSSFITSVFSGDDSDL